MSYLNNQVGYRDELLLTRSVIKSENFVLLEVDGLVKNTVPGYVGCDVTILGSPELGASFVDYLVTMNSGGKNTGIGGDGIECMLYVVSGEVSVCDGEKTANLSEGGYIYTPADKVLTFENKKQESATLFVYKRRYQALEGYKAYTVIGNATEMEWSLYEGMENCLVKDFLPAGSDLGFDMNFHILKFELGASHGYIETHVQEHGMLFLQGKGMYRVDDQWIPVKEGDYMFLDAYCPQACYGVGKEEALIYVYSKDCNRDIEL